MKVTAIVRRPSIRRSLGRALGLGAAALVAACGGGDDPAADTPAGAVAALGVENVRSPAPNLVTSAQPTREQLDELVEMGYSNFISLRTPGEEGAGWEEGHVPGQGASFTRIPVGGPEDLTRENVEELAALLEAAEEEGTVLYCASSNRVGALMALKAFWLDGADRDEALTAGRAAGLAGLEPDVRRLMEEGS